MLQPHQEEGYNFLREADPTFTVEEFLFNGGMYVGYWAKKDPLKVIAERRMAIYRANELDRFEAKSWDGWPRSMTKGTEKWRRKDGNPLTEKDIEALKALFHGSRCRNQCKGWRYGVHRQLGL